MNALDFPHHPPLSTVSLLVTGGAGYIGSHFIHRLLRQRPDWRVLIVDDLSEGNTGAIEFLSAHYGDRVTFRQAKIGDPALKDWLVSHNVQGAVHFAASALVGPSQQFPMTYLRNNVEQSLLLLNNLQEAGVDKLVFSSTAAVYGVPEAEWMPGGQIRETIPKAPVNVYGKTKLMVEDMLALLHERGQLSYIALRYFNAAGADFDGALGEGHRNETHLIPLILQAARGVRPHIKIYGEDYPTPDGTCIRDYIHVYDLADAHLAALDRLFSHPGTGEAFNLGGGQGHSVREVLTCCRDVTGLPIPEVAAPRREGDPPILVANADQARQTLGWEARIPLQAIVESAWGWESNRRFCLTDPPAVANPAL